MLLSVKTPHRPHIFADLALKIRAEYASDVRSNRWRESQNRLAEFGLHGNTYLLPLARLYTAMGGDDEAVRNGDDNGESGADLELFRQLVAMPPKKCRRAACSSMSLCGVATSNCPNKTRKQSSGSRHRRNGVNATSHRTERIMRVHRTVGRRR